MNDPNISYKLLARALEARGFSTSVFLENAKEYIRFEHPHGNSWTTSTSLVSYPFNSNVINEISDNKSKGYSIAKKAGMLTPVFVVVGPDIHVHKETIDEMLDRYERLVVKPDASFGSRGVSINLIHFDEVAQAVEIARTVKQPHANVLVQQQVKGSEFRFSVLNGKVISVMLRETARITGKDGLSIAELIQQENKIRTELNQTSLVRYPMIEEIITNKHYLTSSEVLPAGVSLSISSSAMISGGTSVYEIIDEIHESYKTTVENLANELGAGFIVADIFIEDHITPANGNNFYFNEFNRSPALKMFYASRNGKRVDVVEQLADAIDQHLA